MSKVFLFIGALLAPIFLIFLLDNITSLPTNQVVILVVIICLISFVLWGLIDHFNTKGEQKEPDLELEKVYLEIEADNLGVDVEDIEEAAHKVAAFLINKPGAKTESVLDIGLPDSFEKLSPAETLFALKLGGYFTEWEYGQDLKEKWWLKNQSDDVELKHNNVINALHKADIEYFKAN